MYCLEFNLVPLRGKIFVQTTPTKQITETRLSIGGSERKQYSGEQKGQASQGEKAGARGASHPRHFFPHQLTAWIRLLSCALSCRCEITCTEPCLARCVTLGDRGTNGMQLQIAIFSVNA